MTTTDNKALAERLELAAVNVANARRFGLTEHMAGWEAQAIHEAAAVLREPSTPSAQVSGGGEGIHPDFARLNTIDELADAVVKNTTSDLARLEHNDRAMLSDVRDCLIRAQQLAAHPTPAPDGGEAYGWLEPSTGNFVDHATKVAMPADASSFTLALYTHPTPAPDADSFDAARDAYQDVFDGGNHDAALLAALTAAQQEKE